MSSVKDKSVYAYFTALDIGYAGGMGVVGGASDDIKGATIAIYDKENDYCDITRTNWWHRVYYEFQYKIGGYWNYGVSEYTKIDYNETVTVEAKGTERIRVYIKYRYSSNYSVSFYD